jgi:hypothetical protein
MVSHCYLIKVYEFSGFFLRHPLHETNKFLHPCLFWVSVVIIVGKQGYASRITTQQHADGIKIRYNRHVIPGKSPGDRTIAVHDIVDYSYQ